MSQFAFVIDICNGFRTNGSPTSCKTVIMARMFDTLTAEEFVASLDVEILDTDNATQIETKIRDVVLAEAQNRGYLEITANRIIQPSLQRG